MHRSFIALGILIGAGMLLATSAYAAPCDQHGGIVTGEDQDVHKDSNGNIVAVMKFYCKNGKTEIVTRQYPAGAADSNAGEKTPAGAADTQG